LGSADTWIDPKGFATKFFTKAGVHDLVGNNLEVFPIRDPALFTDINRARKRNPQTHLRDPNLWWDFTSLRPEAALHTLHLFSDLGTPNGFPSMDGAGVHTYKMVNAEGKAVYIKFHWLSNQKKKALTREESAMLAGTNSDYLIQDLFDAIARKEYPSWDMSIQVMTFDQAKTHPQNPFDITKHWRREEYPLIPVGRMTLDRNPTDYFTQVEQAAFSPSHMVPGIEPSPDRMLQARMFSYPDSQRYRLGINAAQLPVNRCPFEFETYQRDGAMNFGKNGGGGPNYFPNSFHGAKQSLDSREPPFYISGDVERKDIGDEDNFIMAKMFWDKDLDEAGRKRVVEDIADFLGKAEKSVQGQFLQNVAFPTDKEFGKRLETALNKSPKYS
jgi:catalase